VVVTLMSLSALVSMGLFLFAFSASSETEGGGTLQAMDPAKPLSQQRQHLLWNESRGIAGLPDEFSAVPRDSAEAHVRIQPGLILRGMLWRFCKLVLQPTLAASSLLPVWLLCILGSSGLIVSHPLRDAFLCGM